MRRKMVCVCVLVEMGRSVPHQGHRPPISCSYRARAHNARIPFERMHVCAWAGIFFMHDKSSRILVDGSIE